MIDPLVPEPRLELGLPCGKRILSRRGKGGESRTFESCLDSLPFPVYEDYELVSRGFARHPGKKLGALRSRVESRAEASEDGDRVLNGACVPVYELGPWDVAATPLVTRLWRDPV